MTSLALKGAGSGIESIGAAEQAILHTPCSGRGKHTADMGCGILRFFLAGGGVP